jgi:hypothetical protein
MDAETQFWMTWWVRLAGTVATLLAVVVALFGDYLRATLFQPKLTLDLVSPIGNKTPVDIKSNDQVRKEMARYYHVRLSNHRKWPKATQAQVYLVGVEEPGPDGSPQLRWSGDVPLKWQWHEIHPVQRTVGPEAVCDLLSVVRGKWLSIETLIQPQALDSFRLRRVGNPVNMTVKLQARSTEGNSPITAFRISWDGQWDDGDAEMARHLIIDKIAA